MKEKPIFRVTVWNMNNPYRTTPVIVKDFRTWKAACNFFDKWNKRDDGVYDIELNWNDAALEIMTRNNI